MATLRMMRAKLHRVRVTDARPHYVGSITIAADLMEAVGLLPMEEVEIVNVDNGARWSTYALPGPRGSAVVCPNGGGARLCCPGDILIVFAYGLVDRERLRTDGHAARVAVCDASNGIVERLEQRLAPTGEGARFTSTPTAEPHDYASPVLLEAS